MLQQITHPTSDPSLPSFVHPDLGDLLPDLTVCDHCWDLLRDAKGVHLPQEPGEPDKAYQNRQQRSSFSPFYRDAIQAYAGSLSRFDANLLPPTMAEVESNIDRAGHSLTGLFLQADSLMLRHGACLLMVDAPPEQPGSRKRQRAQGHRPYLTVHERAAVRNWRTRMINGVEVVDQVTLMEVQERPDGDFGVEWVPIYKVLRGGGWASYELVEADDAGGYRMELLDEGQFLDPRGRPLESPPVIWYAGQGHLFGSGGITLKGLADLTLDHFREYSDLKELLHLTALPTPVRKGALGTGPVGPDGSPTTPAMTIGPHAGIDLPIGGEFSFAEVAGSALDRHQKHLEHIETLIDRQTLSFLFSGQNETATQALLETAQLQASLASVGEKKTAMARAVVDLWCRFTTEEPEGDAGIRLRSGVFDKPLGPDDLRLVRDLYNDRVLSRKSALWLVNKAGLLPPEIGPEDEEQRLKAEEPEPSTAPKTAELADQDLDELLASAA